MNAVNLKTMAPVIILISLALIVLFAIFYKKPAKKIVLPPGYKTILEDISFYSALDQQEKKLFEQKLKEFLASVTIEGIDTEVEDIDRLLIAASAVIPTFHFRSYKYFNLRSVLLYPETFNKDEFLAGGYERNTLGMVGTGPMQGSMILSKQALRYGFQNKEQPHNTGIHEFVHLMDKEDGEVDGLPETLLPKEFHQQWISIVNANIQKIQNGESDISRYATTKRGEFLAVVSEYFFNSPHQFKERHPDLHKILSVIYKLPENHE